MWGLVEPVSKYLLILMTLLSVLPGRFDRKTEAGATLVWGVAVMTVIYRITKMPQIGVYSYAVFLALLFSTALIWGRIFCRAGVREILPWLFFLINAIVFSRGLADSLTSKILGDGYSFVSVLLGAVFLGAACGFMILHRFEELNYVPRTQYILVLLSAGAAFLSYQLWLLELGMNLRNMVWIALFHSGINLLLFYLMSMVIREQWQMMRLSVTNRKHEMELAQIHANEEMVRQCYEIRHELKNTCFQMQVMLKNKEYERLGLFLERYVGEKFEYNESIHSGNRLVDAILSQKIREARTNQIPVMTRISLRDSLPLTEDELSAVLLNLLDNAIEAECHEKDREIQVEMDADRGMAHIQVKNKVSFDVLGQNPGLRTTKRDGQIHGIGLQVVREIAARRQGKFECAMEGKNFVADFYV